MQTRDAVEDWLDVDGCRAFYRRLPAGPAARSRPPLLLVHGISCCTETWAPFLEALSHRADAPEILVPDLPAHGRSRPPGCILDMEGYAAWLLHLLERLRVPRVDVMGHSMGGQVALALAQQAPESVGRLVLLGATTGGRHVSTLRSFLGLVGDSTREPLAYNLLLLRVFRRMGPLRYLLTVRKMQCDDAFRRARALSAPSLVLQGTRDLIVPMQVARALAGTLPDSTYAQVKGAAHAAQFSRPEETAETVLRFLKHS